MEWRDAYTMHMLAMHRLPASCDFSFHDELHHRNVLWTQYQSDSE